MRIISKFTDYFDSVMSEGQDLSLVYFRVMEQIHSADLRKANPALNELKDCLYGESGIPASEIFRQNSRDKKYDSLTVKYGLILFAGRIYPFARLNVNRMGLISQDPSIFFYKYLDLKEYTQKYGVDLNNKQTNYINRWNNKSQLSPEAHFEIDGSEKLLAYATKERIPSALMWDEQFPITINPRLSDVEFFRRLGPYEAFQEMSMFIGNMASPEKEPSQVEDKYKIIGHGFDLKQSFRKRPSS